MKTHGISEGIKEEIAKAIVRESQSEYSRSYQGESFVVDTDGDREFDAVMFREASAQWNPWHDSATALAVAALFEHCEGDVDFSLDADPDLPADEDEAEAQAVSLALEYMPDYYPPFDVNEDDDDIEEIDPFAQWPEEIF